jgi:hypothetical protein
MFQDFRTLACVPLLKDDKLYGALTVYSSTRSEYEDEQQRLLKESASILTNALWAFSEKPIAAPALDREPIPLSQNSLLTTQSVTLESDLMH